MIPFINRILFEYSTVAARSILDQIAGSKRNSQEQAVATANKSIHSSSSARGSGGVD